MLFGKVVVVLLAGRAAALRSGVRDAAQLAQSVSALLKHGGSDDEVISKFQTLAQVTPGAEKSMHAALKKVMSEIDESVISKITAGHDDTQAALDKAIVALETSTEAASTQKSAADKADENWFTCVKTEKNKRVEVEQAVLAKQQAETNRVQPCVSQDNSSAYSLAKSKASFSCDFSIGNCAAQMQNFETQMKHMMDEAQADLMAKKEIYMAFKTDCDENTRIVETATRAHEDAVAAWRAQSGQCLEAHEARQLSVCLFGSNLRSKCSDISAFADLLQQIDSASSDGVAASVYSHPDRVQEWNTAALTKCMLTQVISGAQIDSAALSSCKGSLDFDSAVGELNKYVERFAAATSSSTYAYGCTETGITFFNGEGWETPSGESPASTEYIVQPFKPVFKADADSPLCSTPSPAPEPPAPAPATEPPAPAPVPEVLLESSFEELSASPSQGVAIGRSALKGWTNPSHPSYVKLEHQSPGGDWSTPFGDQVMRVFGYRRCPGKKPCGAETTDEILKEKIQVGVTYRLEVNVGAWQKDRGDYQIELVAGTQALKVVKGTTTSKNMSDKEVLVYTVTSDSPSLGSLLKIRLLDRDEGHWSETPMFDHVVLTATRP